MAQPEPYLWGKALIVLREVVRGWTQQQLADAAGIQRSLLSQYESGRKTTNLMTLRRIVAAMDLNPSLLDRTVSFLQLAFAEARLSGAMAADPDDPAWSSIERIAGRLESAMADPVRAAGEAARMALVQFTHEARALEARDRAPALWGRLRLLPAHERRAAIQQQAELRSWALVEVVCAESLKAAPDKPEQALDLAELAARIAAAVPGSPGWRARVEGSAWAHVGNARRVLGDLKSAGEAFDRFSKLWKAGAPSDPGLLNEALVLGLEASFRRGNRQLPEALALLDRALEVDRGEGLRAHLLISASRTLEAMGDYEEALAMLQQAAPLVDGETEPRLVLVLHHNLVLYLCHLGRHLEAEPMLPGVRAMVERLGTEIDLVRFRWLEGKVAAGRGRVDEAEAAFRHVRGQFVERGIAYDTALATMELAALYAGDGRGAEVKLLARQSAAIFADQGVPLEARRALRLFRQAAEKELLTAELARSLVHYLYRAQHDPRLRFEGKA